MFQKKTFHKVSSRFKQIMPEAVEAKLAPVRLGAIHSVVFRGGLITVQCDLTFEVGVSCIDIMQICAHKFIWWLYITLAEFCMMRQNQVLVLEKIHLNLEVQKTKIKLILHFQQKKIFKGSNIRFLLFSEVNTKSNQILINYCNNLMLQQ